MNLFGKNVSKVTRLEPSESVMTPPTNDRHCLHLKASLLKDLKQILHLHPWIFLPQNASYPSDKG